MPERVISPATYIIVLVVLVLLTFLTVGVSFLPIDGLWHIVIGLTIGLCKATLVVLFFMHVLFSPRLTQAVIAVAVFWLVVLLLGLTLSDYFTRGMIPHSPGH